MSEAMKKLDRAIDDELDDVAGCIAISIKDSRERIKQAFGEKAEEFFEEWLPKDRPGYRAMLGARRFRDYIKSQLTGGEERNKKKCQ